MVKKGTDFSKSALGLDVLNFSLSLLCLSSLHSALFGNCSIDTLMLCVVLVVVTVSKLSQK